MEFLTNIISPVIDYLRRRKKQNIFLQRVEFIKNESFKNINHDELINARKDLIEFVKSSPNSDYYTKELTKLMPIYPMIFSLDESEEETKAKFCIEEKELKTKIAMNKDKILSLVKEFAQMQ